MLFENKTELTVSFTLDKPYTVLPGAQVKVPNAMAQFVVSRGLPLSPIVETKMVSVVVPDEDDDPDPEPDLSVPEPVEDKKERPASFMSNKITKK